MSKQVVRITTELPLDTIETLRQLAQDQQSTISEALRRAVAITRALHKRLEDGYDVLLEYPSGDITKLHFVR